ncbi:hypothetical protein ACFRCW_15365 [Streptomyces sp. NPDC056653]|uniref:hypothetical protein n=1 Tax=Streptomyces sp. NPDC056653 TaxID=3345894 RepID=UPI0036CEAD08
MYPPPDEDPLPRPKHRTFTSEYELRIVAEYDSAPRNGKSAVLRRERLYHSHVKEWRAARGAGAPESLAHHRTSPARVKRSAAEVENEKLRQQVERLQKDLARNKAALDVMEKASALRSPRMWCGSPSRGPAAR